MDRNETIHIYGKNAVMEAAQAGRGLLVRALIARERRDDEDLMRALKEAGVPVDIFDPRTPPRAVERDAVHQGVVGEVLAGKLVRSYDDFIQELAAGPDTALAILGEVQDPHNVGAIIRSAAAFGIAGVLIPEHNQAQVTGAVVKVSAGMAFKVPLVSIGNVNTTARDLKERGFWVYGLDAEAKNTVDQEPYDRPSAFIVGNEGSGMREKTREVCDILVSIPTHPRCESLNVSVSAAIAFSAWSRQHPRALIA